MPRYAPSNPSPENIQCELCEHETTTGICAFCASAMSELGVLEEWEKARDAGDDEMARRILSSHRSTGPVTIEPKWATSIEGRIYDFRTKTLKVTVHRYVGYPPEAWLLTCVPFFDKHLLDSTELAEAQREAKLLVFHRVLELAQEVQGWDEEKKGPLKKLVEKTMGGKGA